MHTLALVEALDHVCCRYRIRAFAPALAAAGLSLTIEGLAKGPWARLRQFAGAARFETVLLQRKLLPGWQLDILRKHARRLIFDFDDAVLYRDSYDPRGPHCRRRAARFAKTVFLADLVLAGNEFLARTAIQAGADPRRVRVLPTCVDTQKLQPAAPPSSPPGPGSRLDRLVEHPPGPRKSARLAGTDRPRGARRPSASDLRPFSALRPSRSRAGPLERGHRSRRAGRQRRGHKLGSGRSLEPWQVRPEAASIPGLRLAGRHQSGRRPSPDRPRAARWVPGRDRRRLGRGRPASRR